MKLRFSILSVSFVVFLSFVPAFSQSPPVTPPATYQIPREVKIEPIVRRMFRSFYVRSYAGGPIQELMSDGFFPIGWSRDGKFAYYTEPVDEECGCYFAELVILDLRTDAELYHFKNQPTDRADAGGAPLPDDMRKLWRRNEKAFTEKLRDHGIVQLPRFALLPATFRAGGNNYTASITKVRRGDPDDYVRIRKISLDLVSPTLGKKSLYSNSYTGENVYVSPLDSGVAGAFVSPYENRAAVVMLNVQRGWEGPPHTVGVQIAGADLKNGFKKK